MLAQQVGLGESDKGGEQKQKSAGRNQRFKIFLAKSYY